MRFLRKNLRLLVGAALIAATSCSFTTKSFDDPDKDKVLLDLISYVLDKAHYSEVAFDEGLSVAVYDRFINDLDPFKRYFTTADIKEFSAHERDIHNQLQNGDLAFFELVYDRLLQRVGETKDIYRDILGRPFDYTKDESITADYDELPFVNNTAELRERWRLQLKYSAISNYYDLKEGQSSRTAAVPGLDEDDDLFDPAPQVQDEDGPEPEQPGEDIPQKSDAEMEQEARESVLSSLDDYFDFIDGLKRDDYFAMYVNAVVEQFDPHTNYMPPQDKDRFDVAMSGKLEGIGARLQKERDNVKIVELISGGPAWRSEQLEVGDRIIRVRQQSEEDAVSLAGMRLDDAVNLIKGPKGTKVFLTVKKMDDTIEEIGLIRDVVEIEETYAKSSLIRKRGDTYGLINLPRFYFDMDNYKNRNAAGDVKQEITRLKEAGMEGLVLDLRNNGGGSLKTAIDIAGLFIHSGPVVQVLSSDGKKEVLDDRSRKIEWDGPLVILVNEVSASASEILAAAMQDYNRAIVIGSEQTYGKGTVQNLVDLNRWIRNNQHGDMGALKVTTQKFYRVNGSSTQLKGVQSDVVVPDRYSYIDIGERDYDNPMPYDVIAPARYRPLERPGYLDAIIDNSKSRMAASEQLGLIDENARWIKSQRDRGEVPLRYEQYVADIENNRESTEVFDAISEYNSGLEYSSLPYEEALFEQDADLAEKRSRWHKNLGRDVYVEEAVMVLEDFVRYASGENYKVAKSKDK